MTVPLRALALALMIVSACTPHDEHDEHGAHDDHDDHVEGAHVDEVGEHDEHDEGAHVDEVVLDPDAIEHNGIRVGTVQMLAMGDAFDTPAEVHLDPDRVAHISPLVEGQLTRVDATLGDTVVADAPLAELRSVALGQARAELERADAMRDVARQTLERQERLRAEQISSERALLEAQLALDQAEAEHDAARSRLRVLGAGERGGAELELTSPIDGVVLERHATRGETVSPDDTLFVIADLSRVQIVARVYEQDVGRVALGMPASLSLRAYPGESFEGTVSFVSAAVDPDTRALPVRIDLDNTDGRLRPGMFGTLTLRAPEGEAVPVVPLGAVQQHEGADVLFVPGDEPGAFVPLPVTLGRAAGGQVEIVDGVSPGDSIVVDGAFVLRSELTRDQLGHGHAH